MPVRFGMFLLDEETRELLRGDTRVPLSPKAFELLSILVAERPKAISKSDLQDRLWPATFVVEKNLTNLVGQIREALGDDPSKPAIHSHCAIIRSRECDAAAQLHGPASGRIMRGGRFAMRWYLLAFVISSIAVILVIVRTRVVNQRPDVGAVSDQWVAAHRSSEQQDY